MNIYKSAEDYLETILFLQEKKRIVRSVDVAAELGFSKPSVSVAMKKLRESGCIRMEENGQIILLPKGEEIAQKIGERHRLLTTFFVTIGVNPETAEDDACKIEHDLSDETFEKLKAHLRDEHDI